MNWLQSSANIDNSVSVSIRCRGNRKPTRHRFACRHATASLLLTLGGVCAVVFVESHAEGQSAELADPIPVLVDGKQLDVERLGCAAPCVFDLIGTDWPICWWVKNTVNGFASTVMRGHVKNRGFPVSRCFRMERVKDAPLPTATDFGR